MSDKDNEVSTNEQIADLILSQTYEERVSLAAYIASAVNDILTGGGSYADLDDGYFATLLAGWADNRLDTLEPQP